MMVCFNYQNSLNYQIIIMQKLFVISYTRTLQRLGLSSQKFPNFQRALSKHSIKPTDENLLFRIPREDFRTLIYTHCPINSLESPHAQEIIKATKLLRHQAKLKQAKVCSDCRFMKNCREAKKTLENVQYDNTLRDLLIFLYGLQMLEMGQKYYSKYHRVYKINDHLMQIIEDLSRGGKQFELFSKTREQMINSYVQQPKKIEQKVQNAKEEEDQLAKRAAEFEKASGFGRDFSFDEQSQFDHALSKEQKIQQTKIQARKQQEKAISEEKPQNTIKVLQKLESKAQPDNLYIKPTPGRRRRRSVRPQQIQTDNLKLNIIRKSTEINDQSNHPRLEQLRRKIQLHYQQQQNLHPNLYHNKRQPTKSDRLPSQPPQKTIKYQKLQFPPPRK